MGAFDDLIPSGKDSFADFQPGDAIRRAGGFAASAKQSAGSMIKGAGQFATDFIPGVGADNPVKRYGQDVIEANPTAVHSLGDIADNPMTAAKEAVGNAGASMAGIIGARLLGQGITMAAPLAGPGAPVVAGIGQGISLVGPYVAAALPSFGAIREEQRQDDSIAAKASAALGAGTVGLIENKFGPQEWALSAMTKTGRGQLAEKFAAKTATGSFGKGLATGAAVEGAEELVQNPIEQFAAFQDPTTPGNVADTVFSGAMGVIGGGLVGGPIAGLTHRPGSAVVPRADGLGVAVIDPANGPISQAAAEHVHRSDAQVAETATGDLFGDMAQEQALARIEPAGPFTDLVSTDEPIGPLQAWLRESEPVSLEDAQALSKQSRDAGYDGHTVIPHGAGFTTVPQEWLNDNQVKASAALQPKIADPLSPRVQALIEQYDAAGHPEHSDIILSALKNRAPTEKGVAFWEEQFDRNSRTWEAIAGNGLPVKARLRTSADLWEGGRELAASQFVPARVTTAVLARLNALVQKLAERGIHLDEIDSRFPSEVTAIKAQESSLRGLLLRYAKQLEAKSKGYKRFNDAALAKTQEELFREAGLTIDQAASQANTSPSEAQIAAGNYAKGHVKVGPFNIAIENPAGSTRTGPGWSTIMQDHYGYIKQTRGADGDQVDVYVRKGTPADHNGPVFVVDQYDPKTDKFDEHKAMIGYRFLGAAVKAYDAHFNDGSGPKRRRGILKMSAAEFNVWVRSGQAKKPANTVKTNYIVNEPDAVSGDLFVGTEHAISKNNGKALHRQGKTAPRRAGTTPAVFAIRQAPDVEGLYHVSTQLVSVGERNLPVKHVRNWQDAANVFGNLSRYAVEHFDVLVTDKVGKALAIIGSFKGAATQAAVYPGTVMMELARIDGAAHVWMAHNHPSGTPDLSRADLMLSGSFEKILSGSGIEYHGLAAVARNSDTISWTNNAFDNGSIAVDQPIKFSVPIVEREIIESNPAGTVSSPATAKRLVASIAKDQPGVLFLTAQNGVSAFVPFKPSEMGELRRNARLIRLFRAASKSGGVGALVAMPDGKVSAQQFANIKGALGTVDIKVLDGIEYDSSGVKGEMQSLAERGLDLSAGHDFFSITPPLLAPNGKPSNLSNTQHAQVRTQAFKDWFGDWENDPANASQVIDANGEPLVVFHGSRDAGAFRAFKANGRGLIWAGSRRETAASYAGADHDAVFGSAQRGILPVFLNIRNPSVASGGGKNYFELPKIAGEDFTDGFAVQAKASGHDGAIIRDVIDDGGEFDTSIDTVGDSYAVFRPEQLESAQSLAEFDRQLFAAISYGAGTETILGGIATRSASPFNRELAKLLQSQELATSIETTDGHIKAGGSYNAELDRAQLHTTNNAEQIILHELVHAATVKSLSRKSVAAGAMRALLKTVRKELGADSHYGLKNVFEFTAEAFTNPEFQQALRGIKVETSISGKLTEAWQRFVSNVRQLIGLGSKYENALGRAIELGARLMSENKTATLKHPLRVFHSQGKADAPTVRDWVSYQLANNRNWALGALTRDQIADIYGNEMPEVRAFDRVVQQMDQERQTIAETADALIERWRKLKSTEADVLADVMHTATLEQFDPDIRGDVQTPEQSIMLKAWKGLSPGAQQLYRDVRNQYAATLAKLQRGLVKRAERTDKRTAAAIRLEFDRYLAEGPYFPLARFGDFILIAEKHEMRTVEAFESSAARAKRARQLRVTGWITKETARKNYSAAVDGPAGEFVGQVLKLVDGLPIEASEKTGLMDSLNQLAIGSLPDQSYRKHFAHRKGVPGFSTDAMRAFASSMQHVAHHVAKVMHGDELTLLVDSLNKRIRETTGDVDTTAQQQVSNELAKRLDLMMNPVTHPVTAALGQVGFIMSLGGSVASGITNLSQTALVTYPWLGARFGFDKAAAALTLAGRDYFGGKWDKWSGFVLKSNASLSADEAKALNHLEQAGLINLTQAHDLAGTANTDSTQSRRAFAINRAMKIIGWTFHVPEVFNRQVSALAAYRLARGEGQSHDTAIEQARQALIRSHFDYSASNRARLMHGNFTRVISMFKQYSQNMTYLLWRNAHQALRGESPEVRREARRMLLGVASMHFAAAGTMGLPLGVFGMTPLLGLLSLGMGDEDDPWDWQAEFRNLLADMFGKEAGEAIAHGPLRTLTGIDMAARVGLGDLWIRMPQAEKEGRDQVEAWMLTLLGPVAGYAGNLGAAVAAFDDGKYGRGLESLLPKAIASPIKALRYGSEGVKSWRGDDLGVKLDSGDIFAAAMGFQPSQLAEMFEGRAAIKGREAKLNARREEITNTWIAATMAGDAAMQAEAMDAAANFTRANPSLAINALTLRRSLQSKLRMQTQIEAGVHLTKKREGLRTEGRFANV